MNLSTIKTQIAKLIRNNVPETYDQAPQILWQPSLFEAEAALPVDYDGWVDLVKHKPVFDDYYGKIEVVKAGLIQINDEAICLANEEALRFVAELIYC